MINICFIVSSLCNSGPVNVMYNIIQYIDFSKFRVSVVTLIPEKENSRLTEFERFPLSIHQLAETKKQNPVALYKCLRKTVAKINPDILHSHCPRSLYLMNFLPKKYKRVYTIHIYPGLQQKILYGKLKGEVVIALNHYFTKKVDFPVGCAESVADLYKMNKGWNIAGIPNGSSLPVWKKDLVQRECLRRKLGYEPHIKYFIFIGRFSSEKKPDMLIQAFKKLRRNDIALVLLGDGPSWVRLKKEEETNILIPGFKNNIYEYLIASDYYISASDVEGLANTLLESMSVGLPMLLSDIPSHREVLSKINKTAGFLFDNKSLADLTDKIQQIIAMDMTDIYSEVNTTFEKFYTAKHMSESYQNAYFKLFSKAGMKR